MSSHMNQNNLTVTVASAATSLLLLGMFYPNSSAARRRRRKLIEGDEDGEDNDDDDDDDDDEEYDDDDDNDNNNNNNNNDAIRDDHDNDHRRNSENINDDKRSTISSIVSSTSSLSLLNENKQQQKHQKQQQQQQQQQQQNKLHENNAIQIFKKTSEKSILKHGGANNGIINGNNNGNNNGTNGNIEHSQNIIIHTNTNKGKHVQYIEEPTSDHSSHSLLHAVMQKQTRTQSMSDDSEDSDLSYGEDLLTKNFRHIRQGSFLPNHGSIITDTDLSITVEDSQWGDSSSQTFSETSSKDTLPPLPRDENDCIYLDYNGTTPIHPMVLDAMVPYFTRHFGNPSSSHAYGLVPRAAVGKARRAILYLLHGRGGGTTTTNPTGTTINGTNLRQHKAKREDHSIVFTGCGTEADNLAIRLALESYASSNVKKKHIITSNVEHPAIDQALKALEAKGECEVTFVPVNKEGIVSTEDIVNAIRPNQTILVTLMLANNESGALQPVREVSSHCRKRGILFHTDAAQAAGKVSLSLEDNDENGGIGSGVDMVTIVGHKMGAPKGVAALYIRPGCLDNPSNTNANSDNNSSEYISKTSVCHTSGVLANNVGVLLVGGGQENGLRAGTENVPYIVAIGCAASLLTSKTRSSVYARWEKNAMHMEAMRSRLLHNLTLALGEDIVRANGPADASQRLPNTLSVGLKGVDSAEMLKKIQMHVACSAGSACHAQGGGLSPVLKAMGVPEVFARGTLRLSVGPSTRPEDVDKAAKFIVDEARRQISP